MSLRHRREQACNGPGRPGRGVGLTSRAGRNLSARMRHVSLRSDGVVAWAEHGVEGRAEGVVEGRASEPSSVAIGCMSRVAIGCMSRVAARAGRASTLRAGRTPTASSLCVVRRCMAGSARGRLSKRAGTAREKGRSSVEPTGRRRPAHRPRSTAHARQRPASDLRVRSGTAGHEKRRNSIRLGPAGPSTCQVETLVGWPCS